MSWGRLDDTMWRNTKVMTFSDRAFRLWVLSLSFGNSADSEPLGHLTEGQACMLMGTARATRKTIAELVEKRGWDQSDDGYRVHDLDAFTKPAETGAERQRRYRERHSNTESNVTRDVTSDAESDVSSRAPGDPVSRNPVPTSESKDSSESSLAREGPKKRRSVVTREFEAQMVAEYAGRLGGDEGARYQIELYHAHGNNWQDKRMALRNWLHNAVTYRERDLGRGHRTNGHVATSVPRGEDWLATKR